MSDPYDEAERRDRDTATLLARGADFRLGRWQDVAADVECDAWIGDGPYGKRTHKGHGRGMAGTGDGKARRALPYQFLTPSDVRNTVRHWAPRTRGWFCTMTSHDLIPHWSHALKKDGRKVFAPLPVLEKYKPRMQGDGPGSDAVHLIVARPRSQEFIERWREGTGCGSPAGHYERAPCDEQPGIVGGKSLSIMLAIVRDYSCPGDLVCDPFSGLATTGRAALELGRLFIGCEKDPATWMAGRTRLLEPIAVELFSERHVVHAEQGLLWSDQP